MSNNFFKVTFFVWFLVINTYAEVFNSSFYAVDFRDLIEFKTPVGALAQFIQKDIQDNTCKYLQSAEGNMKCNAKVKLTDLGAMGPEGQFKGQVFITDKSNNHIDSRQNVIYAVEFDSKSWWQKINASQFQVKIIMLVHDETRFEDSKNYYFKKITLNVSFKSPVDSLINLNVLNKPVFEIISLQDIPLKNTYFSFYTDIVNRKTILFDKNYNIIKVFPVGLGSLDVRTFDGMDNFVGSLTEELKDDAALYVGQRAGLYQERNSPWYYKGRPFLGVMDHNGSEYREIGYHYQIDDGPLVRGFISHGCIRVRDKDLYQQELIVFSRLQERVPVKVVNSFAQDKELIRFDKLEHPLPKTDVGFNFVNYANKEYLSDAHMSQVPRNIKSFHVSARMSEVERYLWCTQNGLAQPLRVYGDWSSALDEYCLTKISHSNLNVIPFIEFIMGNKDADAFIEPLEPAEPKMIEGLCKKTINLSKAIAIYQEQKNKRLTFGIYVDHCGCKRFKSEIGTKIFTDMNNKLISAKQVYQKYCGNE